VWLLEPTNCVATEIFSVGGDIRKIALAFRDGLVRARARRKSDDDTSRLQVWSQREQKVVFDRTSRGAADVPFDVVTAGERILLADANTENDIDNVVRFVDVRTQQDVGEFMIDTASCCYPSYLRFHPDRHRLLTGWNDRGIFRLRLWRVLPTIEEMRDFARATVPECLSPERRKELGLEPDPPPWCIEAAKRPYDTAAWKQWLAEKIAGKNPSIPR
jgi:hypothetical protein